jgi:signal transduction histidine kinase
MKQDKTRTIAIQILGSIITIMLVAIVLIATFSYKDIDEMLTENALTVMNDRLTLEELKIKSTFNTMKSNIEFISKVPPIQGIIRSDKHEGYDPDENTTRELWKKRLISIFTVILEAQPYYTQMRFIGEADGGREIVRVNKLRDTKIEIVPDNELQKKAKRYYYIDTSKLGTGEIYLSRMDLNQEWGKIATPHQLVTRIAIPIYDETNGTFYGIVIINVDMSSLFTTLKTQLSDTYFLLTDNDGFYLYHPDKSKLYGFDLEQNKDERLQNSYPETKKLFTEKWVDEAPSFQINNGTEIIKSVNITLLDPIKEQSVILSLVTSKKNIIQRSLIYRNKIFFISMITLLILLVAAYYNTRRIIKPIKILTRLSEKVAAGDLRESDLSDFYNDEIGQLAESFNIMVNEIDKRSIELEEANEELNAQIEEIIRVNEELNNFSHIVSHDLKSPLTSILGMSDMLKNEYGDKLDETCMHFLTRIIYNAGFMAELINGLLELSRVGRVEEESEEIDSLSLIENILTDNHELIKKSKANIKIGTGMPCICFSRIRLYQVFSNFIKNALKFTRDDVIPEIRIDLDETDKEYIFSISDNGIGIDEKDQAKVFEMFTRLKKKDVEGTGIGMAIVKKIIEESGGRIWVKSKKDEGSTFYFTFLKRKTTKSAGTA